MFKHMPIAPLILLIACPAPKIPENECQQYPPYALSLNFTDVNGNAFQPFYIEYSASNGESGSADQNPDGTWTIEEPAYGEIEVIVTHEFGEDILDFTVLYDSCNHPVPQEHTVALDVDPCNEEFYSGYQFFFKESNGANVVADEVFYSHDGFDWIEYDCESNNCSQANIEPSGDELWVRGALDGEAIESRYTVIYDECGLVNESHDLTFAGESICPNDDDLLELSRLYGCGDIDLAAVNSDSTDMVTLDFAPILSSLEVGVSQSFSATDSAFDLYYERGLYLDEVYCGDIMMNERYVTQTLEVVEGSVHITLHNINEYLEGNVTVILEDVVLEDTEEGCSTLIEELIWDNTLVGWFHG